MGLEPPEKSISERFADIASLDPAALFHIFMPIKRRGNPTKPYILDIFDSGRPRRLFDT